jgi:hypothetical protein
LIFAKEGSFKVDSFTAAPVEVATAFRNRAVS